MLKNTIYEISPFPEYISFFLVPCNFHEVIKFDLMVPVKMEIFSWKSHLVKILYI